MPKQLWKTTIVIWSDEDPADMELEDIAREATSGGYYCSQQKTEVVTDKKKFPAGEFFGTAEEEE